MYTCLRYENFTAYFELGLKKLLLLKSEQQSTIRTVLKNKFVNKYIHILIYVLINTTTNVETMDLLQKENAIVWHVILIDNLTYR